MSHQQALATAACPRCGSVYRRPGWGREYLCPACGRPLQARAGARRWSLPIWTAPALLIVVLAGVVVRVAQARAFQRVRFMSAEAALTPEPVELPPHFHERLDQKAAALRQDLQRRPDHPVLLAKLAECYLYLAVLEGPETASGTRYVRQGRACAGKLRPLAADVAAMLDLDLREPRNLRWTTALNATAATRTWSPEVIPPLQFPGAPVQRLDGRPASDGGVRLREFVGGPMQASPDGPFPAPAQPLPVRERAPFNGPPPAGGRDYPGLPHGSDAFDLNGPSTVPPGFPPSVVLIPNGPPPGNGPLPADGAVIPAVARKSPEQRANELRVRVDRELAVVRRRYAHDPANAALANELGRRLVERGRYELRSNVNNDNEGKNLGRPFVLEGIQVYERAAAASELRMHKAAFLLAAAEAFEALQDWEGEYRLLQEAAENAPYAVPIWRDLEAVCLRTGRLSESRRARARVTEWTFPGLRPAGMTMPGRGGRL